MRTYVRDRRRGDDPARRPRRVLRVGRAARRSAPARAAGDRRGGRRARGELRGEGVRRRDRDGRRATRAGCARGAWSSPRACRPTPRRAGPCSRSSRTRRRSSRGSRSTRRSSTCAGWSGSRARRREIAARLRRDVRSSGSELPITVGHRADEVPREGGERRRQADGLLVVPPDGELAFLHPLPVERLWGVGARHRRQAARAAASRPSARSPRLDEAALVALLGPRRRAGTCTRSRTTAIRGRCRCGAGAGARSGRSGRSGGGRRSPEADRRRPRRRSSTASTRRMRAAGRVGRTVVLRLRFDDFSRATRSHTLPHATAETRARSSPRPAPCSPRRMPTDRAPRAHAGRHRGREPRRRPGRSSSRCRSIAAAPARSTPRSTRCATASARVRSPGPCCSAATRG